MPLTGVLVVRKIPSEVSDAVGKSITLCLSRDDGALFRLSPYQSLNSSIWWGWRGLLSCVFHLFREQPQPAHLPSQPSSKSRLHKHFSLPLPEQLKTLIWGECCGGSTCVPRNSPSWAQDSAEPLHSWEQSEHWRNTPNFITGFLLASHALTRLGKEALPVQGELSNVPEGSGGTEWDPQFLPSCVLRWDTWNPPPEPPVRVPAAPGPPLCFLPPENRSTRVINMSVKGM